MTVVDRRERLLLTVVIGQGEIWEWYLVGGNERTFGHMKSQS